MGKKIMVSVPEGLSHPFSKAKIIVDFYCFRAKLVIELDGGGHYHSESQKKDQIRTRVLENYGLHVLRFCNLDIDKNFYGVCTIIDNEVKRRIENK